MRPIQGKQLRKTSKRRHALGLAVFVLALAALLTAGSAGYGQGGQSRGLFKGIQIETTVFNLCNQAGSLQASGNYAQARDVLLKAVSYDPTSYSSYVHRQLAQSYKNLKDLPQAVSEAQLSMKYGGEQQDILYFMAELYFEMEKFDQASACLKKYVQLANNPQARASAAKQAHDTESYRCVSQALKYMESGRNNDATRLLERVTAYDPNTYSAQVHSSLSFALQRTGNPTRAIAEGKKALQFDPQDRQTVYNIGIACEDLARFDEAMQWINRYISMEPDQQQREEARKRIESLLDDKKQADDPDTKLADYLDEMRKNGDKDRWIKSKIPIKIYISSGAGVKGYKPAFTTCILRSFDAWCEASGNRLNYTLVKDKNKADIIVQWTSGALNATSEHPNATPVGLTEYQALDGEMTGGVTITIRTTNPFYPGKGIEPGECASTVIHEVGHALGLGHSKCIRDVMYFRNNSVQKGLPSKRDRATIARLYSDFPVLGFTPHTESEKASPPIEFLPPPTFLPSRPPDRSKLPPPMFLPPPIKPELEKLRPPMFTPPPVNGAKQTQPSQNPPEKGSSKAPAIPLFVPPPAK